MLGSSLSSILTFKWSDKVSDRLLPIASRFCGALMKVEHRITIPNAPYPILRVFASWPGDAKLERTIGPKDPKKAMTPKSRATVDEDGINEIDPDRHPLAALHLVNFIDISENVAKLCLTNNTEQVAVVFAERQYNNKEQV